MTGHYRDNPHRRQRRHGMAHLYRSTGPGNVIIIAYNTWETQPGLVSFQIAALPQQALYMRCQHDPVNKLDLIEAWTSMAIG